MTKTLKVCQIGVNVPNLYLSIATRLVHETCQAGSLYFSPISLSLYMVCSDYYVHNNYVLYRININSYITYHHVVLLEFSHLNKKFLLITLICIFVN